MNAADCSIAYTIVGLVLIIAAWVGLVLVCRWRRRQERLQIPRLIRGETDWIE